MNREWEEMKNKATAKFSGAKIPNDCLGSVWSMYVEICVSVIFFSFFSLLSLSIFYGFDKYSKRVQLGQDADQLMTEKSNVQINHWLCCACAYSLSTYSINGQMASRLYDAVYCIVNWVCVRAIPSENSFDYLNMLHININWRFRCSFECMSCMFFFMRRVFLTFLWHIHAYWNEFDLFVLYIAEIRLHWMKKNSL